MSKPILWVHAAKFHTDDVLCGAMGKILGYEIKRTLDHDICIHCGPNDLVCDIGRQYDGMRFFDHHQPDCPLAQGVRLDGRFPFSKVAAAGLLWAAKGREIIKKIDPRAPYECVEEMFGKVDFTIIAYSDRVDVGEQEPIFGVLTMSGIVGAFNMPSTDPDASTKPYMYLVDFFKEFLTNYIKRELTTMYGRKLVSTAPIVDGKFIVFDQYLQDWSDTVICEEKFNGCVYAIYPSARGGWNAQTIPVAKGEKGVRRRFPIEWIGCQSSKESAKAMGLQDDYQPSDNFFIHEGRWLINVPTKDLAIKACRNALKYS